MTLEQFEEYLEKYPSLPPDELWAMIEAKYIDELMQPIGAEENE
jgi:hypothetical protein